MVSRDAIESAYSFFHQKERVYAHSTLSWQKDDIEYAISEYIDSMNQELYQLLSGDRTDFLKDHTRFPADMRHALEMLDDMLTQNS